MSAPELSFCGALTGPAEDCGLDKHVIAGSGERIVFAAKSMRIARAGSARPAPCGQFVLAEGPCAARRDHLEGLARFIARVWSAAPAALEAEAARQVRRRIEQADAGAPEVSGIEVVGAAEAFEQAAEASGESPDVCYGNWLALEPGALRGEFLRQHGQFLTGLPAGRSWLQSQMDGAPAVNIEAEYGVLGR